MLSYSEAVKATLRSKIEPSYAKSKPTGVRSGNSLAELWIKNPRNRTRLIYSNLTAGLIVASGKDEFETYTLLEAALNPHSGRSRFARKLGR